MSLIGQHSAVCCVLLVASASLAWAASITITSPSPGTIVSPGQSLAVTVDAGPGTTLQKVTAGIAPLSHTPLVVTAAPYHFTVTVPAGQVGALSIVALALDSAGNTLQASTSIVARATSPVTGIQVVPNRLLFAGVDGQLRSLNISASFQNGTTGYVMASPDIQFVSSNPKVATVTSLGQVQAAAPGTSAVTVSYSGFTIAIPVMVGIFLVRGDLSGDGAVDQNDIQMLLKVINTGASGPGDPRDLNKDGRIDALDSRILVTLCSRPLCATR